MTTPEPPEVPPFPEAPLPGTYYDNAMGQPIVPTIRSRGGALTAFMVLEWITAGFGVLGICGGFASLASSPELYTYFLLIIRIATTSLAFASAYGITQYKKYGIKYGWIEVCISWFLLIVATIYIFATFSTMTDDLSNSSSNFDSETFSTILIIIITIAFALSAGWTLAKTLLLRSKSARESVRIYFT